jgi:cytochrome c peroxidase
LFVSERLDDAVLAIDPATLKPLGRIRLGEDSSRDPIRRGERVFTKAAHTFQRQFSCRSCHPDGHVDGLSYDFDGDGIGDNFLDNRSLLGVAGTAPFKWIGKNPSLEVQCGPRFARVLMRTDPIPPADLKDLSTFLQSQPPPRWERNQRRPLTPAQERGKALFFATTTSDGQPIPRARQCATCHRPPLFTNRLLSSVGTKGLRDTSDLFDTPHLLGIGQSAPYLHDGRAKTLEELWTVYQTNDLHGVSSYMNKHQLNDLVDYLKTL